MTRGGQEMTPISTGEYLMKCVLSTKLENRDITLSHCWKQVNNFTEELRPNWELE